MVWLTSIINFFKRLDSRTLAFIAGAVLILFMMQQCNTISNLKEDVKKYEKEAEDNLNNYLAAKDSITYFTNELGDAVAQVSSYKFKVEDLEKTNLDLNKRYVKVLGLNAELEGVNSLLYAEIKVKDSIIASTSVSSLDSLTGRVEFNRFDNFGSGNTRSLNGFVVVRYDPINKKFISLPANVLLNQTLSLTAAIEEIEGRDRLKISSAYPGLVISKIENINLVDDRLNKENKIDKKAGFSIGMGVGYGINLNPSSSVITAGPTINVGLYYSPAWLRF